MRFPLPLTTVSVLLISSQALAVPPPTTTTTPDGLIVVDFTAAPALPPCWTPVPAVANRYTPKSADCMKSEPIGFKPAKRDLYFGRSNDWYVDDATSRVDILNVLTDTGVIEADKLRDATPSKTLVTAKNAAGEVLTIQPTSIAPRPRPRVSPWSALQCATAAGGSSLDLCIDVTNDVQIVKAPLHNILEPNQSLTVAVRHWRDESTTIDVSGTRGVSVPALVAAAPSAAAGLGAGLPPGTPDLSVTILRFGPRKAGSIDVVVKLASGPNKEMVERAKVELEVEERYWGAARFGLATVFGDFRGYEAKSLAGSQTAQITENRVPLNFEFVVGFAPYLESLWGGRGYSGALDNQNIHVAPFLGFGLLGQSVDKLDALTSFHGGLELEFARDFSLAATVVVRRARKLSDGYAAGSPKEFNFRSWSVTVPRPRLCAQAATGAMEAALPVRVYVSGPNGVCTLDIASPQEVKVPIGAHTCDAEVDAGAPQGP